jgi:hypothetical protein
LTTSESEDQVEGWLLLDVIVRKGSAVFELLTGKDKSLLIGWDTFFVLDLSFHVLDGVWWLNVEGDGLTGQGLNENLHTTSQSEDQVKSRLFLDVIVWQGSAVFKLLTSEDKSLLIGWDTFFVLDLGLDVLNSVGWLNIKSDGLSSKGLNEDLHTTSKSEDQMEGWLLLNVVIGEGSTVFQLFSSEDQSLLIGWDTFLVLDLSLDIFDGIWWLNV